MSSFLWLQSDGVVDGLVSSNLIRRNIHKADRFGCGDNCSYLFIDRETFHLFVGLLGKNSLDRGCKYRNGGKHLSYIHFS